jgi:hypothetical protein
MNAFWHLGMSGQVRPVRVRQVITLGDLMRLLAVGAFVDHFALLVSAHQNSHIRIQTRQPFDSWSPEAHDLLVTRFSAFRAAIETVSTPVTRRFTDDAISALKNAQTRPNGERFLAGQAFHSYAAALAQVTQIFGRELEGTAFYCVTSQEAALIAPAEPHWGADLRNKFSSILFDLDEAAACMGFARGTAAVFHLMRIMEVGIAAMARSLGIPDPVKPSKKNWGAISRTIQAELKKRDDAAPPNWKSTGDKTFFHEMFVLMESVRSVWRNATMHPDRKHTPEEATDILGAVKGFMTKISSRLDENGDPKA